MTPTGLLPIHEASASIEERPGTLYNGRMMGSRNVPMNSIRPKFIRSGMRKAARRSHVASIGTRLFIIVPPVRSLVIASGPKPVTVMIANSVPSTRSVNHSQSRTNISRILGAFLKLLRLISVPYMVTIRKKDMMTVMIVGMEPSSPVSI